MSLDVTVTAQHDAQAVELYLAGAPLSSCCVLALALYDALGRTVDREALGRLESGAEAAIWAAFSVVGIDGKEFALPDKASAVVALFDGRLALGGPSETSYPVTFTLEGYTP